MYTPARFRQTDPAKLHEFIEQHSFGTLLTQCDSEIVGSHLPFLLDRDAGPHGRLLVHMARENDQWRGADGAKVLAIFHGPHAYISPRWYTATNVVPTWNYVAVHVHGPLRLIADSSEMFDLLRRTVAKFEPAGPEGWSIDNPDAEFIASLLDSIVGFEIEIERIEGNWKLSQHHDQERRASVARELLSIGGEDRAAIAKLMSDGD